MCGDQMVSILIPLSDYYNKMKFKSITFHCISKLKDVQFSSVGQLATGEHENKFALKSVTVYEGEAKSPGLKKLRQHKRQMSRMIYGAYSN